MNGAVMTLSEMVTQGKRSSGSYMRKGSSLRQVESCEITRSANQYIEDHPEIIAFATESYRSLVASGRLRPPRKRKLFNT